MRSEWQDQGDRNPEDDDARPRGFARSREAAMLGTPGARVPGGGFGSDDGDASALAEDDDLMGGPEPLDAHGRAAPRRPGRR